MRRYLFISAAVAVLLFLAGSCAADSRVPADGCCDALVGRICDADTGAFAAERRFGSDFTEPAQPNIAGPEQAAPHAARGARAAVAAVHAQRLGSWRTVPAGVFCGLFIVPRRTADYYVLRLRRLII